MKSTSRDQIFIWTFCVYVTLIHLENSWRQLFFFLWINVKGQLLFDKFSLGWHTARSIEHQMRIKYDNIHLFMAPINSGDVGVNLHDTKVIYLRFSVTSLLRESSLLLVPYNTVQPVILINHHSARWLLYLIDASIKIIHLGASVIEIVASLADYYR